MRTKDLIKKYPEQFAMIEAAVWDDMNDAFKTKKNDSAEFGKQRRRVAYNAAASAIYLMHKAIKAARKTKASNNRKLHLTPVVRNPQSRTAYMPDQLCANCTAKTRRQK